MGSTLVAPREGRKTSGVPTEGLILFTGHPKSGKSTTAAKFPEAYVLELEKNGGDRIDGSNLRIHDIKDLDTFGEVLAQAIEDPGIRTIVIDTIDELESWMQADILKGQGKNPASGKPTEKNFEFWSELLARVEGLTTYLKESGKLVILVAHCKPPKTNEKGVVIVPAGINVAGKGGAYIAAQAEAIAYISKRVVGGKSVQFMSFNSPSDMAIWGSRIDELDGKEIMVSRSDPYGSFAALFAAKEAPKAAKLLPKPAAKKGDRK